MRHEQQLSIKKAKVLKLRKKSAVWWKGRNLEKSLLNTLKPNSNHQRGGNGNPERGGEFFWRMV